MPTPRSLTPDERAMLELIAACYPALAAAVETQATLLLAEVLPVADGAIATEAQLDVLLESVVTRVVAASDQTRSDPPTELEEAVDTVVLLMAREAVEQARPGLVARVLGAKQN
jgi:hypothetical protein